MTISAECRPRDVAVIETVPQQNRSRRAQSAMRVTQNIMFTKCMGARVVFTLVA